MTRNAAYQNLRMLNKSMYLVVIADRTVTELSICPLGDRKKRKRK